MCLNMLDLTFERCPVVGRVTPAAVERKPSAARPAVEADDWEEFWDWNSIKHLEEFLEM